MYFLSWCTDCTNSLDSFYVFFNSVLSILFCTVFGVVISKLIHDKFIEPKKLKYSFIIFGVMCILVGFGLCIWFVPLLEQLASFIADKLYGTPNVVADKLPSAQDVISMNGHYVMTFILTIPLFSYLYFLVIKLLNDKKKKNKKTSKWVVVGTFVICLIIFGLLFGLLHEPVINSLEKFYTCSNVC